MKTWERQLAEYKALPFKPLDAPIIQSRRAGGLQDQADHGGKGKMSQTSPDSATLKPCPLCQSTDIQLGVCYVDGSSTREDAARCGNCGCRATKRAWQSRGFAQITVVPEGWQLVPKQPTELMLQGAGHHFIASRQTVTKMWNWMLSRAPTVFDTSTDQNTARAELTAKEPGTLTDAKEAVEAAASRLGQPAVSSTDPTQAEIKEALDAQEGECK